MVIVPHKEQHYNRQGNTSILSNPPLSRHGAELARRVDSASGSCRSSLYHPSRVNGAGLCGSVEAVHSPTSSSYRVEAKRIPGVVAPRDPARAEALVPPAGSLEAPFPGTRLA
jgi:hypothetical protein